MTAPEAAGRWSVEVDRRACIGSGMCVATAPERFRLDGGRAQPLGDGALEPGEDLLDAAQACPAEAILVRDAAGGVLAPEL